MKKPFEIILDVLALVFIDFPLLCFYILIAWMIGYFISNFIIAFPCSIWETVTKKKINEDIQNKIIHIATICIGIVFFYMAFSK